MIKNKTNMRVGFGRTGGMIDGRIGSRAKRLGLLLLAGAFAFAAVTPAIAFETKRTYHLSR